MSVKCQTIINLIEQLAPRRLAEEWDNVGLNIGDPAADIRGVLVTLDVNQAVIAEALGLGANMVISHHPVILKPLKNIRADLPHGKLIQEIIKNDIAVFCAHTNLDSAKEGVNQILAQLLDLINIEVLNPDKADRIVKLVVFVPTTHAEGVREALTKAGAGWIGNYSDCTFSVDGTGTFRAAEGCDPFIGEVGVLEKASEIRVETVIRERDCDRVVKAMIKAHPYEEVAYDLYPLMNDAGRLGMGRIGLLEHSLSLREFLDKVKKVLNISTLKYGGNLDSTVRKVAVCGGSGAGFVKKASFMGADVLLTGDIKYHEAQEALSLGLRFIDAGHYSTEIPVVTKLSEYLEKAFCAQRHSVPVFISREIKDTFDYY